MKVFIVLIINWS